MHTSFDVSSSTGSYPVRIGPGLIEEAIAAPGERVFVVDAFVAERFRAAGLEPLVIEADEHAKSLDRITEVIVALRERRATRGTRLVAVGGGVVQDVAAFAASIYMRGLDWTYVPTTLLAMTDSCIGGKSSINVGRYKNIVGTFHPPAEVLVDPAMTATLSAEQRAAGLIEAAKISLCRGADSLDAYLALAPSTMMDTHGYAAICNHSLRAKKWFVEVDEFDANERLLLNFGHTFGHALEAATNFAVSHGIGVGLGMLAALRLGEAMGRSYVAAPQIACFRKHIARLLDASPDLPAVLSRIALPSVMDAFASDKKHGRDRFALITVDVGGRVQREFLPRDDRSAALIEGAYTAAINDRLGTS
ncbi:3-dehydroquinate synthase family protein [Sphingomonas sp.]|jgi:3-dehydroquinate synthase|uniref:3-dehydroquinate synthase n=1 Tax=Sphingomonas sp. TaxID=28214 RepID=UPI002D810057|nr:3-dehydroquinate synthase family protein [Sphingomonas sp.]HEU0044477.1 3-dehydroquinate synthase family protein [Sphingomonas sp.]